MSGKWTMERVFKEVGMKDDDMDKCNLVTEYLARKQPKFSVEKNGQMLADSHGMIVREVAKTWVADLPCFDGKPRLYDDDAEEEKGGFFGRLKSKNKDLNEIRSYKQPDAVIFWDVDNCLAYWPPHAPQESISVRPGTARLLRKLFDIKRALAAEKFDLQIGCFTTGDSANWAPILEDMDASFDFVIDKYTTGALDKSSGAARKDLCNATGITNEKVPALLIDDTWHLIDQKTVEQRDRDIYKRDGRPIYQMLVPKYCGEDDDTFFNDSTVRRLFRFLLWHDFLSNGRVASRMNKEMAKHKKDKKKEDK